MAAGAFVASSASTSARVSICRLMPFWTGLASTAARAASSEDHRHRADLADPGPPAPLGDPGEQAEQADAEQSAGGAERRAGEHVVVAGVRQLVGDHRQRLLVGEVLDEGVVDDHPAGAAEARTLGVERRRTTGRVGHEHVVDLDALLGRRARGSGCARPVLERREGVEERLDHAAGRRTTRQRRRPPALPGDRRPGARPSAGDPDQGEDRDRGRPRCRPARPYQVERPGRPRRRAEPDVELELPMRDGERQGRHRPITSSAATTRTTRTHHRPGIRSARRRPRWREAEPAGDGERHRQRAPAPHPRPSRVVLGPLDLVRA